MKEEDYPKIEQNEQPVQNFELLPDANGDKDLELEQEQEPNMEPVNLPQVPNNVRKPAPNHMFPNLSQS